MSFKVVRVNGVAVAFGPNEDHYEPGMAYVIEDDAPTLAPVVPQMVTRFQAKAALLGAGLLEQVEVYMALPDTPMVTKLAWTETQDFERASPTVAGLAALLGLTSEQVDELFITASGITA